MGALHIFPISPIFILFFITFFQSVQVYSHFYRRVVVAAGVFAALSLFLEVSFVEFKLVLNLVLVSVLLGLI